MRDGIRVVQAAQLAGYRSMGRHLRPVPKTSQGRPVRIICAENRPGKYGIRRPAIRKQLVSNRESELNVSNRRALVVEDSSFILLALEMLLEQHGVNIVGSASTIGEALVLSETGQTDIAILDINLHGQTVFPAADLLIQRGIPIIFTTGYDPKEILPPRYAGMPTVRKPYNTEVLMRLVEAAFASAEANKAA